MQVIYIDILLLINFSMDFIALFLTAHLIHEKARALPLASASLIGAVYEALRLFVSGSQLLSVLSDVACAVLMCVIAFGAAELIRTVLTFVCSSVIIGGTMTALYSLAGMGDGLFSVGDGAAADGTFRLPFGRFIPAAAESAAFGLVLCRALRSRLGRKKCSCLIRLGGRSVELSGLCDSGNLLCDPLSGKPCILLTQAAAAMLLPPELCTAAPSGRMGGLTSSMGGGTEGSTVSPASNITDTASPGSLRIRIIPMHTPTGNTLLTAVVPDSVSIGGRECSALIAAVPSQSEFGGADALVPAALL